MKFLLKILLIPISMILLNGCIYDELPIPSVEGPVSFSEQLVPIFVNNCSVSNCHEAGKIAPDLTAENAYNSLLNFGYVIPFDSVGESNLMVKINPGGSMNKHLPNEESRLLIEAWIKQGAENN